MHRTLAFVWISGTATAAAFLEARRWGDCPACPRCGSVAVYTMKDAATGARNKDFRWRCRDCKRMYSVRTGTELEESRLPPRVWVFAFWSACASKKGVSALQTSRECDVSYKSALFLMHRVREAMSNGDAPRPKMPGAVEVDETYVGGKPRNEGPWNKRGAADKIPVMGIAKRGDDVRCCSGLPTRNSPSRNRSLLLRSPAGRWWPSKRMLA